MRLSDILARHRASLLDVARRHGLSNARVFGSVARGDDQDGSDIDLLVDAAQNTTLMILARGRREAEELTGVQIDIHTLGSIHERYRANILKDARPLRSLSDLQAGSLQSPPPSEP